MIAVGSVVHSRLVGRGRVTEIREPVHITLGAVELLALPRYYGVIFSSSPDVLWMEETMLDPPDERVSVQGPAVPLSLPARPEPSTGPWMVEATAHNEAFPGDNWLIASLGNDGEDGRNYYVTTDHIHAGEMEGAVRGDAEMIVWARNNFDMLWRLYAAEMERVARAHLMEPVWGGNESGDGLALFTGATE